MSKECFEHCCVSLCEFRCVLILNTFPVVTSSFLNESHMNCFASHERDKNPTSQNRKWSPVNKRERANGSVVRGVYCMKVEVVRGVVVEHCLL